MRQIALVPRTLIPFECIAMHFTVQKKRTTIYPFAQARREQGKGEKGSLKQYQLTRSLCLLVVLHLAKARYNK